MPTQPVEKIVKPLVSEETKKILATSEEIVNGEIKTVVKKDKLGSDRKLPLNEDQIRVTDPDKGEHWEFSFDSAPPPEDTELFNTGIKALGLSRDEARRFGAEINELLELAITESGDEPDQLADFLSKKMKLVKGYSNYLPRILQILRMERRQKIEKMKDKGGDE